MAENSHIDELSAKQTAAATALLGGCSNAVAASEAGVSERTVRRWRNDPAFRTALKDAERSMLAAAAQRAYALADGALTALDAISRDAACDPGPRVRAAIGLLDACLKWRAAMDTEERLEAIEQRLKDMSR